MTRAQAIKIKEKAEQRIRDAWDAICHVEADPILSDKRWAAYKDAPSTPLLLAIAAEMRNLNLEEALRSAVYVLNEVQWGRDRTCLICGHKRPLHSKYCETLGAIVTAEELLNETKEGS